MQEKAAKKKHENNYKHYATKCESKRFHAETLRHFGVLTLVSCRYFCCSILFSVPLRRRQRTQFSLQIKNAKLGQLNRMMLLAFATVVLTSRASAWRFSLYSFS